MAFPFDGDPARCAPALARLETLGFSEAGTAERLGLEDLNTLQLKAAPAYRLDRLGAREPLDLAIDLFMLQGALEGGELDRLFDAEAREGLEAAGVLAVREGVVRSRASLYPVGRELVFSDHAWPQLDHAGYTTVPGDQVMYVGTDSRWLARATPRRPVGAALDLCCGSGVQALLAARHADRVTAVDINPRAVACTAFNAAALGLGNLEALQGDLYGGLGDRTFDLITANPPFVPAPSQEVGFRDGGPSGEEVQRRIVEGLPRHLARGGTARIVTELGEREGEPLHARLRAWLGDAPMDIHVLRLRAHAAQAYAVGHADGEDPAAFLASVERWHRNLRAQGYRQVVSVLLAFRWSEAPWSREDEAQPPAPGRDAGREWDGLLEAQRLAGDPALMDRLRQGKVARTGAVALLDARALGTSAPPTCRARRAGQAMPLDLPLTPLERDLLGCLDAPVATADLLKAGALGSIPEEAVLEALASLVRNALAVPVP